MPEPVSQIKLPVVDELSDSEQEYWQISSTGLSCDYTNKYGFKSIAIILLKAESDRSSALESTRRWIEQLKTLQSYPQFISEKLSEYDTTHLSVGDFVNPANKTNVDRLETYRTELQEILDSETINPERLIATILEMTTLIYGQRASIDGKSELESLINESQDSN